MVDVTRQVMANAFTPVYLNLTSTCNSSDSTQASLSQEGARMIQLLIDIDSVLLTNENFRLSTWIGSARAWADGDKQQELVFDTTPVTKSRCGDRMGRSPTTLRRSGEDSCLRTTFLAGVSLLSS
jgi:hypothetical protein